MTIIGINQATIKLLLKLSRQEEVSLIFGG